MTNSPKLPPLKSLHPDSYLKADKLAKMEKLSTEDICASLLAGDHRLKTRPDGTILEGHHRVYVLRQRGVDVDNLPREEIKKDQEWMLTTLYWLDEAWPGRIALSARPRGGDWLADEVADWKRAGIDGVLSLLESQEEEEMDLRGESAEVRSQGLEFASLPIRDRQVPASEAKLAQLMEKLDHTLSSGKNVLIHCRQGIGRSGLVAACLFVRKGISPGAAVEKISAARGVEVPETEGQREWIDHYATAFSK